MPAPAVASATKRPSFLKLYGLLVGAPLLGIALVLAFGADLGRAPVAEGAAAAAASAPAAGASAFSLLQMLAQIGVILAVARLAGWLMGRLGQPQVVGEMAAGIMLGPSLLGAVAPTLSEALFPASSLGFLNALSQVGIVLFMFVVGFELDHGLLRERGHSAVLTSHASITAPFLIGTALALPLFPWLAGAGVDFAPFALFLGAAMSVTAFPVLARILRERALLGTHLGAIAITCAAVDDVTAWCILAGLAALIRGSPAGLPVWATVLGSVGFAALSLTVGRRLLGRLLPAFERAGRLTPGLLAIVIFAVLVGAWVTEWLGIHALFGAFVVGLAMPREPAFTRALLDRLEDLLVVLLLPLFFAFTGLRTRFGLIQGGELWLVCGAIVAAAIVGKVGGSMLASRLSGLSWRESGAVGVLMNTRGLVELVFLNVGLELGVLSPTLFAMMVLMALTTTVMTTPLLALIWPPASRAAARTAASADADGLFR
jgi:Kef-type K+ transport system membrane component KefB